MDLSQLLFNSLLGDSSVKTLSKNSGASQDQVQQVMGLALPILMKSMQENASGKKGEESLAKALANHGADDVSNVSAFLSGVDLEDGNKILGHILGSNKTKVEKDIAKQAGLTSNQTSGILANAAPLLLALLGGSLFGGDGLGGILGGALGGGLGGTQSGSKSKGSTAGSGGGPAGGLAGALASAMFGGGLGGGSGSGGGGLEGMILSSLGSVLSGAITPEEPAKKAPAKKTTTKSTAKKTTKKAEPENVLDTLIGSLFGIDGKEK